MRIIQLFYGNLYDDGVGNTVQTIDRQLKSMGYDAEILNSWITPDMLTNRYFAPDDVILYQYSVRMDPLLQYVNCKKVLVFQNITYPELLYGFNIDNLRMDCECGLYELDSTKNLFSKAIVFSEFSKNTLISHGWKEENIFPLSIMIKADLFKDTPDKNVIEKYRGKSTNILFTGRIFPNKKQEDIIRAFHVYKNNYNNNSKLFLVGPVKCDDYSDYLKDLTHKLGLDDDVIFSGFVSWNEYLAYYKAADLFLCMSAHEGFCIPLLESMFMQVPILAINETAIPNTLGDGGLILGNREPAYVADMMNKVLSDNELKSDMIKRGNLRFRYLTEEAGDKKWEDALNTILLEISKEKNLFNPVPESVLRKHKEKQTDIPDFLSSRSSKKIILYGFGAKGQELLRNDGNKLNIVAICDKNINTVNTANIPDNIDLLNIKDSVSKYPEACYIITVQNKAALVQIAATIINCGVNSSDIFIYESDERRIYQ